MILTPEIRRRREITIEGLYPKEEKKPRPKRGHLSKLWAQNEKVLSKCFGNAPCFYTWTGKHFLGRDFTLEDVIIKRKKQLGQQQNKKFINKKRYKDISLR